ncbi:sterile alpha motif domain-containing protein 9-like [Conger conger]|uniref:sterile alpha motif domain-containing protein 9-like n=1 Tax=Conger conger TaxID=82655 RepID=UPI002A5AA4F5|nr:sterile alpha motif domain-containing protein 9-like [Conger conger]
MAEQSQTKEEAPTWLTELPAEIKTWTKDHVRQWALNENLVDAAVAEILYDQLIDGASLLSVKESDLWLIGIKLGPIKHILCKRDELVLLKAKQLEENKVVSQCNQCRAYPFNRCHDAYRYTANSILEVTETGPSRYIEPCHEFKAFIHTEEASAEDKMKKFTDEALRFAAACMNSRTNGTIHFGVGDLPWFKHGEIVGVFVQDKEAFVNGLHKAIEGHFEHKHIEAAKKCIKPPRFVQVLNRDATSSDKYVIEVDIVAAHQICKENIYHIYNVNKQKARKKGQSMDKDKEEERKLFFIRDGPSSKDLLAQPSQKEYEKFVENIKQLSEFRGEAEKKHFTDVKASVQASRLSEMLTGGSQSLDKSHFERYLLITNKSHDLQLESLEFLLEMDLTAVLDFDPESEINGLCKFFSEQRRINTHLPKNYKITEAVENIAEKLKLTKNTSWVFCNGKTKVEMPSDPDNWFTEKGASVRDVVSFLCRKDVLPHKKFLVVVLLLSSVSDRMDPLLESFSMFCQELQGTGQILCICEDESAFTCWNNLIRARRLNISERSIYELSLAEINGTILSLWSDNRRSSRFLPSGGGSKVLLKKKAEECLDTLSILCVNQCEGGTEERESLEESFYKGGEVSWWNFYFCEQPGSMPFIKRDKYDLIKDAIIPQLRSLRQACVFFNLMHFPGCGGTTLAKHILWSLKDTFRCAVLRDTADNFAEVARQVVDLLIYESAEHSTRLPVLLMMDAIEELDAVYRLQKRIDEEIVKRDCSSNCAQVILLNCMRTDSLDQTEATKDTVFIGNNLSESEQKLFKVNLGQIEKTYKNAVTFYGFMIMKTNFSQEYIQSITQNTLKNFNFESKPAQLFAVLTLLTVYWKRAVLSVSLCEDFLGMQIKPLFASKKVEDEFGKFSAFLTRSTVEAKVVYQAMKVIHPSIANCCLQEITTTFKVSRAKILNMLLTNSAFFECTQGKDKLMQDVRNILLKRQHMEKESMFSPVIHAIIKDKPGEEEMVLQNAAKCFDKDAFIAQLLARYQYLKKDFRQAKEWARKAKGINQESSYIADTSAQVIKHELKHAIRDSNKDPMRPEKLRDCLKMARSARDAFRETKEIAEKEIAFRAKVKRYNSPYNLAGCLGEIQVAVIIMDILEKVPVFAPSDRVQNNVLEQVLSGKITIKDVSRNDNRHGHSQYYGVLEEFSDLICELKSTMKNLFYFFDAFFVNLGPDEQTERNVQKLVMCWNRYAGFFCKSGVAEFQMQEFLEENQADTCLRLLDKLSKETSVETMEKIVSTYQLNLDNKSRKDWTVKDRVNFIYANIVLVNVKPTSLYIKRYTTLLDLLYSVLRDPVPHKDSMVLHFIAVALLWPGPNPFAKAESLLPNLGSYISQMKTSFCSEMESVCHGKKPVVHFYLGKKQGYARLVYRADVERFAGPQSGSLGENEMWSHKEVQNLLCRATGVVQRNTILADTPHRDVKIEVNPVYKSQLGGGECKRVSFFIGFSMNGPLAFDVKFD